MKKEKKQMPRFSISVNQDTLDEIQVYVDKYDVPRNAFINILIRNSLMQLQKLDKFLSVNDWDDYYQSFMDNYEYIDKKNNKQRIKL